MPQMFVNDEGTLREMQEIFVNDEGTLRDVQEVWINDSGTLRLVFSKVASIAWGVGSAALAGSNAGGNCTANINLNNDGTTTCGVDNETVDTLTGQDWSSKAPVPDASTDPWTIEFSKVSGQTMSFTGLAVDTEYTLDQTRLFSLVNTNLNTEGTAVYSMTIDDKQGNIVVKNLNLDLVSGTPP